MQSSIRMVFLFLCVTCLLSVVTAAHGFDYESIEDFPLMGDWTGQWIEPQTGHEREHPQMAAQLLPVKDGYRVVISPGLYRRAVPYMDIVVPATHERVSVDQNGFNVVFAGKEAKGMASLNGKPTAFTLTKQTFAPPTVGMKPHENATVLFDGTHVEAWQHTDGRNPTWRIVDGALQVVTQHKKENKEQGLGGDIRTRDTFGNMRFHMEFRYPVEAEASGQGRGNSGLFFLPIGEVQILNSYTTVGYWDEAGAIYKRVPAKVNAAGPPLVWQTYDVTLQLPEAGGTQAIMTVLLNGKTLHNKMPIACEATGLTIMLQDHINPIQFRNIWLVEEKERDE